MRRYLIMTSRQYTSTCYKRSGHLSPSLFQCASPRDPEQVKKKKVCALPKPYLNMWLLPVVLHFQRDVRIDHVSCCIYSSPKHFPHSYWLRFHWLLAVTKITLTEVVKFDYIIVHSTPRPNGFLNLHLQKIQPSSFPHRSSFLPSQCHPTSRDPITT